MRPHQPRPAPHMKGHDPTNTHPRIKGDNGRQDHFRAPEADHTTQHQGGQI